MTGRTGRRWPIALLLAAACLVPAILDALQTFMQARLLDAEPPSWRLALWRAAEWVLLGALVPLIYLLSDRFPLRGPHLGRSLAAHVAGALVLCAAWATCGVALRWLLGINYPGTTLSQDLARWLLTSLPWSVFMYFALLGCVQAFAYVVQVREREAQSARLAASLAEARLGALRMQLHPHFLFNSLNAITVLARDGRTRDAVHMLELLSDVLRQVLRRDQPHEVPLSEELRFLEAYLAIEQIRFSDRLSVHFSVADPLRDAAVPGFVLQPLVENAIRHGLAPRPEGGRVELSARTEGGDLVLSVRDDGQGLPPEAGRGTGVGLANTRERLAMLYGSAARVTLAPAEPRGTVATVHLPWRRLETSRGREPDA
jgi:two-component system, LytTR family, sensor kinase